MLRSCLKLNTFIVKCIIYAFTCWFILQIITLGRKWICKKYEPPGSKDAMIKDKGEGRLWRIMNNYK